MELANLRYTAIRPANEHDKSAILQMLESAPYCHIHVDWQPPVDWIGTPGFVVWESTSASSKTDLLACFAATADPPPAAWVRLAAIRQGQQPIAILESMLAAVIPHCRDMGATQLGWFPIKLWPESWLNALGFRQVNEIVSFIKSDMIWQESVSNSVKRSDLQVRSATLDDMDSLAALEVNAFDPLWRHSARSLMLAYRQSLSFDLAEIDGQIVGFQYSVEGQNPQSAHLVRITVAAGSQNQGIGSALMIRALTGFRKLGIHQVTLNTQVDNKPSHRLYQRFGFQQLSERLPVWALDL